MILKEHQKVETTSDGDQFAATIHPFRSMLRYGCEDSKQRVEEKKLVGSHF